MGRIGTVGAIGTPNQKPPGLDSQLWYLNIFIDLCKIFKKCKDKSCESTPGGCKLGVSINNQLTFWEVLKAS